MALDFSSEDALLGAPVRRRWLCRAGDDLPFAYARGRDYIRRVDQIMWAYLDEHDRLVSARSGRVIAVRQGSVFRDADTYEQLYYEKTWSELAPNASSP